MKANKRMTDQKKRQSLILYAIIAIICVYVARTIVGPNLDQQQVKNASYSEFLEQVDEGNVRKVKLDAGNKTIRYTIGTGADAKHFETTQFPNDTKLVETLKDKGVDFSASFPDSNKDLWLWLLINLAPFIIIFGGAWLINRRIKKQMGDDNPSMNFGGGFGGFGGFGGLGKGFGKSNAKEVKGQETGVTFKDVAGQDEAKDSLREIVSFLDNPKKYAQIGARCPKGALLVGPPGTGKTLLAKAVAGEANVCFFQISGSEFVEMFVGRGAAKVRDLFKQAKEKAPCIIFIDELDTVGKKRGASINSNDEREQTLNQLLAEMDGFDNHEGIVVLAATNRPETLDLALLRPGRFDRRIPVELPDLAGREAILKLHANDVKMEPNIDFAQVARQTPGTSGADLANMINEAALRAVRMGRNRVCQSDIEESVDVVVAGEKKKSAVLSEHERKVVSYHETGHAIVAAVQNGRSPVSKITIIPRTSGALGFTMQAEEDERYLTTKEEYKQRLAVLCGGRVAEELIFGHMSSGAADDIEKATKIARAMVTQLGMSENFGMVCLGDQRNKYLGGGLELTCSEGTAQQIDKEIQDLIHEAHETARKTLEEHKFKLHEIARYLQLKETITGDEFMAILNKKDGFAPTND